MKVYLDHAATTPLDLEIFEEMKQWMFDKHGNPSSKHSYGKEAREAVEKAREIIIKKMDWKDGRLVFTSGGTEGNNFIIKGIAHANKNKGKHLMTSEIEHPSVLNVFRFLEREGFSVSYVPVDSDGIIDVDALSSEIRNDTILVSIAHANNEIGTIQPIEEIGKVCTERGVIFHTDGCQSLTKVKLDVNYFDAATINAHKIHGPKGVGAVFIKDSVSCEPLFHGGGQEWNLRSGTENVPGIVGFGKAVEIAKEEHNEHMKKLRNLLVEGVEERIQDILFNGHRTKRLCNNINFSFNYVEGEALMLRLDMRGIACSTGSACSSNKLEPSHVLLAIGRSPEIAHGSLRMTTGRTNTVEEMKYVLEVLEEEVENLRKISPFGKR